MKDTYKNEIEQVDNSVNPAVQNQLRDVFGNIEVVSAVPTEVPIRLDQQIKIYVSGGTSRFYIYDTSTATWKYATLL
jgi:regulator of protease activity HflC (stomatin/prohibitin superfamily)